MRNMAWKIYDIIFSKMWKNSVAPMKLFDIVVRKKIWCDTKEELVFVEFNFIVIPTCLAVRSRFQKI